MRLTYEFTEREVVGEHIFVPLGRGAHDIGGMVYTNEAGCLIMRKLQNEISREELLAAVLKEFDVDEQTASRDLKELISDLRNKGFLIG